MTKAERAVLETLTRHQQFLSAQQIHADLRERGSTVGLTSVYRAVQALRGQGEIDELRQPGGESGYRRCRAVHHHHLTCASCGNTIEIEAAATERWLEAVARSHDYTPTGHTIELTGLCPACQAGRPASAHM